MENSTEEQREEIHEEAELTEEKMHSNLKGTHQTSFKMWSIWTQENILTLQPQLSPCSDQRSDGGGSRRRREATERRPRRRRRNHGTWRRRRRPVLHQRHDVSGDVSSRDPQWRRRWRRREWSHLGQLLRRTLPEVSTDDLKGHTSIYLTQTNVSNQIYPAIIHFYANIICIFQRFLVKIHKSQSHGETQIFESRAKFESKMNLQLKIKLMKCCITGSIGNASY